MNKRLTERVALVIIAIFTIIVMSMTIHYERKISNQRAMFYQLEAIRTSVNLFKAINKRNPTNLQELIIGQYSFPGEEMKHSYLQYPPGGDSKDFLDPFGNPYAYESLSGWVRSTTRGYEFW